MFPSSSSSSSHVGLGVGLGGMGIKEKLITDKLAHDFEDIGAEQGFADDAAGGLVAAPGLCSLTLEDDDALELMKVKEKSKALKEKTITDRLGGEKAKNKKLKEQAAKSRADRAGLIFPVGRIHNSLRNKVPTQCRVGGTAAVFQAAVMEYMMAELLELSGKQAKNAKRKEKARITPQFLNFAIKHDREFDELLSRVMVSGGGVLPKSDSDLKNLYAGKKKMATKNKNHVSGAAEDGGDGDGDMLDAGVF
ncbi:unnamed protein product [Amoebophrya sp. A25]|nr:unnamed protein product [Amoebophrya sp. A25]|eukprot:GSA25T00023591001.1